MAKFYLSSTYLDLSEYRERVSKALRSMGHEVVGMENYTASGAAPLKTCLEDVAKCDAYIGIFAWRYGYIPKKNNPAGRSITELEYRQAVDKKIEPLIFILKEEAPWSLLHVDENKKPITVLRSYLWAEHSPALFGSADELTVAVMAAASRFRSGRRREVKDGKDEAIVEDDKDKRAVRTAKPHSWKLYGLVVLAAAALLPILFHQIRLRYWPDEYPTEKKYEFLISEKAALPGTWHLQPAMWDLERGEGEDENVGALLIKGNQMATPKDLGSKVFYDYQADFKVRFESGDKVAWVLRAQSDGQSGYLFELRKEKASLFINGWVLKGNKIVGAALPGGKTLRYSTCCKLTDAIRLIADVTDNHPDGTHIKYQITLETDLGFSTDDSYKTEDTEFIDSDSIFGWGSIGLLVTDGITEPPTTDGVMRVEYVNLTPLRRDSALGSSLPEGTSR